MLKIGRHDQNHIQKWVDENHNLFSQSKVDEEIDGFSELTIWFPYILSFLNAIILVSKFSDGIDNLLDKAKAILRWSVDREKKTEFSPEERILGLVFKLTMGREDGVSPDEVATLSNSEREATKAVFKKLSELGVIVEVGKDKWSIRE